MSIFPTCDDDDEAANIYFTTKWRKSQQTEPPPPTCAREPYSVSVTVYAEDGSVLLEASGERGAIDLNAVLRMALDLWGSP